MTHKTKEPDKQEKPEKTATVADLEQKPFDPWTATLDEALAEDQRREILRKEILKKERMLRKEGLAGEQEYLKLIAALNRIDVSALKQREMAISISKEERESEKLSGLQILGNVACVLNLQLPCPHWLTSLFLEKYEQVAYGRVKSFGDKSSFGEYGKGLTARRRWAKGIYFAVYTAVEKMRKENPGKYVKRCGGRKSVFLAVSESETIKDHDGKPLSLDEKAIEKIYNTVLKMIKRTKKEPKSPSES